MRFLSKTCFDFKNWKNMQNLMINIIVFSCFYKTFFSEKSVPKYVFTYEISIALFQKKLKNWKAKKRKIPYSLAVFTIYFRYKKSCQYSINLVVYASKRVNNKNFISRRKAFFYDIVFYKISNAGQNHFLCKKKVKKTKWKKQKKQK